jgi:hypothetical protein
MAKTRRVALGPDDELIRAENAGPEGTVRFCVSLAAHLIGDLPALQPEAEPEATFDVRALARLDEVATALHAAMREMGVSGIVVDPKNVAARQRMN